MRSLLCLLAAGCGGAAAGAPPAAHAAAASPVDITPVRDDMRVYDAGKGHFIALVEPDPEKQPPRELMLFWGDGKVFHAVPVWSAQADGLKFEIGFKDARIPASPAGEVKRERGKTELECWGEHVELKRLDGAAAGPMLAAARFEKSKTEWSPVALGKDRDRYLYVDAGYIDSNSKRYRVFEGQKGSMKSVEVIEGKWDNSALTIKTAQGVLRVTREDSERTEYTLKPAWEGKKGEYSGMPRAANWRLIYEQLGVYSERPSPTPCDPMLP